MMEKIKVGVFGGCRGNSMIQYCRGAKNAVVVAICDKFDSVIEKQKEMNQDDSITYYTSFDEFIKHDMDVVVVANYADEHAPFAIRCLKAGKHVFSEVLPCQNMKEAVELIETVEETGLVYAYGENFCYMAAPYEMRKLYREGKIGEFEYGEGEYVHNCENEWHNLTQGDKNHWRNRMYSTFYCTHSVGPLIHITGLRPVSVVGFESTKTDRARRMGQLSGQFGIEMITLENGGIIKSIHGGLYKDSVWFSAYGSKGRMESAREDSGQGDCYKLYVNADSYVGEYGDTKVDAYDPKREFDDENYIRGHGGADFYSMYYFIEKVRGNKDADIIDVYEAMDMFLPGMFAHRSLLNGGIPMEIPNLRDKAQRDKWRNDTTCISPQVAGDMLVPIYSKGNPDIPDEIYDNLRKKWEKECEAGTAFVTYEEGPLGLQ